MEFFGQCAVEFDALLYLVSQLVGFVSVLFCVQAVSCGIAPGLHEICRCNTGEIHQLPETGQLLARIFFVNAGAVVNHGTAVFEQLFRLSKMYRMIYFVVHDLMLSAFADPAVDG